MSDVKGNMQNSVSSLIVSKANRHCERVVMRNLFIHICRSPSCSFIATPERSNPLFIYRGEDAKSISI